MLQIPKELEKQVFDLEGRKYTFYSPSEQNLSTDEIQFLVQQTEGILQFFLSYIESDQGFVFDDLNCETSWECQEVSTDYIKLEAQYCNWCSIFIDSVPYNEGGYHIEIVLYFWKNQYDSYEVYKELVWSNENFVL